MRARPDHNTSRLKRLHPLLRNASAEGRAVAIRLVAYLGSLGALAWLGLHLWSGAALFQPAVPAQAARAAASQWAEVIRPQPAFAVPVPEFTGKDQSYKIQRHQAGGRKDTLRVSDPDSEPVGFEAELYRPGQELSYFPSATDTIAARADVVADSVQTLGVIETKFGAVPLIGFVRTNSAAKQSLPQSCTGFVRDFETPRLQISGFSCHGETPQLQRQSIACAFDRLTILSSGSDATLAALFARAELKRMGCNAPLNNADWITATRDPNLRGSLGALRK